MKLFTAIFLIAVLGFQMFLKTGVVAHFYLNQSYIAAALCENRDNPAMHCNGKCYLKKQLKKADETERNKPLPAQNDIQELQPYIFTSEFMIHPSKGITILQTYFLAMVLSDYSSCIFHPPGA